MKGINTITEIQFMAVIILSIVPWPGPTIYKISCPRDNAAIVRKLVEKKWLPILEKYRVSLPVECPFHPLRDIYHPQESAKRQFHPSQWYCQLCGKSFYSERYLDSHFDNKHAKEINMAEDSVCLADYCDIMRCQVMKERTDESNENDGGDGRIRDTGTDLEVWREPSRENNALTIPSPLDKAVPRVKREFRIKSCHKSEAPVNADKDDVVKNDSCETLVDSVIPPKQRYVELQKLKANCKPQHLAKLKTKCQALIRHCIIGLLVNLSTQEFKDVEDELNDAFCWYLSCDKYWEDSPSDPRKFSWALVVVPAVITSLSLTICYYALCIYKDPEELILEKEHNRDYNAYEPYTEQYYLASSDGDDQNEHYIYVTYPPEIKKRLMDNCYNRTTRI